ncbi:MAG TPA: hypothetical protein PKV16_02975 [Caldisericia bacterium]|nr:hypothetical protein [Caldisericia bacterium]HPF48274.1 hypothetical protein [Caldisericia bacterium]HPI83547.1 hypothetical protein [Caldisericia bacterium]HPQ92727.1 hypothetical protein [Caldisericia bacterium]HRV74175.1 hypothetical protein [Caldisericia bacterium]
MKLWRRAYGDDYWHWNPECPDWPTDDYEERKTRPDDDEICDLCDEYADEEI